MSLKKIFFTKKNISIKEAILKLKDSGTKCLIVVDKKNKLLGTLTDGDLRDVIVKKIDLNKSISNFYNKKPKYLLKRNYTVDTAKQIFQKHRIDTIPVLDSGLVVDIITWSDLFLKKNLLKNLSVVIIAGGKGERLKPVTHVLPKPLIPIYDKTIIDYIIEQFSSYEISNFYFTLNYKAELIKTYLKTNNKKVNLNLKRKKALGTVHYH